MSIFNKIFRRKKKITDFSVQELLREEKRLEIRENQMLSKVDQHEKEREKIFDLGAKTKSIVRRKMLARRFNDIMMRINLVERDLNRITKELMTISRVRTIIERTKSPVTGILAKMNDKNMAELEHLLEDDKITEEVYLQKLDSILGITTDPAYEVQDIGQAGMEILKTWEAMDEGEIEFEDGLKRIDKKTKEKASESDDTV